MTTIDSNWQKFKNNRWTPRIVLLLFLLVIGLAAYRACG